MVQYVLVVSSCSLFVSFVKTEATNSSVLMSQKVHTAETHSQLYVPALMQKVTLAIAALRARGVGFRRHTHTESGRRTVAVANPQLDAHLRLEVFCDPQ